MANTSLQQEYMQLMRKLREFHFEGFFYYMDFEDFAEAYKAGGIEGEERQNWIALDTQKFVRLRYTPKPDELYDMEGIKLDEERLPHMAIPVCLIFDSRVAGTEGVRFAEGDATYRGTVFYKNMEDAANQIDWRSVFRPAPTNRNEHDTNARMRATELLYPEKIPMSYVEKIVFRTEADKKNAIHMFGPDRRFEVNNKKFFCFKGFTIGPNDRKNIFNYILDYDIEVRRGQEVEIIYRFASDDMKDYHHEFTIEYKNGDMLIDDEGYFKAGVLWHWIGELDYDMPFTLTYTINGHQVIYYRYGF